MNWIKFNRIQIKKSINKNKFQDRKITFHFKKNEGVLKREFFFLFFSHPQNSMWIVSGSSIHIFCRFVSSLTAVFVILGILLPFCGRKKFSFWDDGSFVMDLFPCHSQFLLFGFDFCLFLCEPFFNSFYCIHAWSIAWFR